MTPGTTAQALLELVAAERDRQCAALRDDARARAATILAEAHAGARRQVREAFEAGRLRADERIAAAHARLQTERRLHRQRRAMALLEVAWQKLPGELLRRWQEPAMRRDWTEQLTQTARAVLSGPRWHIEHPADWPAAERQALAATLGFEVEFVPVPALRAGLRIRSGGNIVDGTLEGLLADRGAIGARLLALQDGEDA